MNILEAAFLGIVQGLTEFIPVSSSGHLVLVPWLLGWESAKQPSLAFDTVVHMGTMVALVGWFWRDWWMLLTAWFRGLARWDWRDPHARLACLLVGASIPAALLGMLLESQFEALFSEPEWVSAFLLVTAVLLVAGERWGRRERTEGELGWRDALAIGLAQAAAIAPGISRSGATMSTGLLRGLERPASARFSFLLATPIVAAAGLLQIVKLAAQEGASPQIPTLVAGFAAAALSGYLAIGFLMRWLQRRSLNLFALYCIWVGVSCLVVSWLR